MKTGIKKILAMIGVVILSMWLSPCSEGQLLKKISKGLEKVNKTLEKVDKTINGNVKSSNQSSNSSVNSNAGVTQEEIVVDEVVTGTGVEGSVETEASYSHPYLTSNTLILEAEPWTVSNAYDGVFSVKRNNNRFEFWKVDGQKLFDANWESCNYSTPEFHDGVVAMRKASEDYKLGRICLLYTDGRVKEMDPSWKSVTNFVDGVAIAVINAGGINKAFYIDTTGKRLYPSVTVDAYASNALRPLSDGMRAFTKGYEEWGYIDANGVVKMAPKFKSVSDFSEGYAWVVTSDGTKQLIDKTGKSIFKAPDRNSATSDVVNGRFYVEKGNDVCYYDLQGNLLKCFEEGNCFYDGYAFVTEPKDFGDINSLVIDKNMNVVREMNWKVVPSEIVCEHGPKFTKSGLAAVNCMNGSYLLKPNGDVVLSDFDDLRGNYIRSFSPVSDCGYLVASNLTINDIQASAILKPTGEIVWLISESMRLCGPYKKGFSFVDNNPSAVLGEITLKMVDIHQAAIGPKATK